MSEIELERHALKALRGELEGNAAENAETLAQQTAHDSNAERGRQVSEGFTWTSTLERVPSNSSRAANEEIRRKMEQRLALYADHPEFIDARLEELEREWDIERVLQVEGPLTTTLGLLLFAVRSRRWLIVPAFAQSMMAMHALHGFYPLLRLLRRAGLRTEQEISEERYALKAMRGDFEGGPEEMAGGRADKAFEAAQPTH